MQQGLGWLTALSQSSETAAGHTEPVYGQFWPLWVGTEAGKFISIFSN